MVEIQQTFGWTQMQLHDEERRLRLTAEEQVRSYNHLLEEIARTWSAETVDQRRRHDPSFFQRLTVDGWRALFMAIQPDARQTSHWQLHNGQLQTLTQQLQQTQAEKEKLAAEITLLRSQIVDTAPDCQQKAMMEAVDAPIRRVAIAVPERAPAKFATHFHNWAREAMTLSIIAQTGWSLRHAIAHELSAHLGISSRAGSLKRMFAQMDKAGLWRMKTVEMGRNRAVIAMLTDLGKEIMLAIDVEPVSSEWEQMLMAHGGERQNSHTALVCTFAHQARLRGYETSVCPHVEGNAEPDVQIVQDEQHIYVEVEAESGEAERRMRKWQNQAELQGYVALCAPTPEMRTRLVAEGRAAAKHGKATDVSSLMRGGQLWLEEW